VRVLTSLTSTAAVLLLSAAAAAAAPSAPHSSPPSAPTTKSTTPGAPATARLSLVLASPLGHPPLGLAGVRMVVRGTVSPYVAGQRVTVRFFRDGRKVAVQALRVRPADRSGRSGGFELSYTSPKTGVLVVRAVHDPTPQLARLSAAMRPLRVFSPSLHTGARGPVVRALQSALAGLHYAVPGGGVFNDATGRAVIAYRKLTREALVPDADARLFDLLQRGAGSFHVRYPHDGRHIEADLSHQVLAEINPGGHVRQIYITSSGKPSTPTVVGRFRVYTKSFGVNAKGMVDSSYFISGYAIHGYPDVPTYAASHGCLRIPIPDAPSVYNWLSLGVPVDVYHLHGGGSQRVRGNAGP
jgi:peptidoglycan hydrolase-like protein with peptidoglycan-binding domain